ncbi:MAG: hypothetical protein H0X37_21940 [Herpetosiphonaceae bacterium]|nr:hypothetical protein [Herpetosiphonaceae bacterium]
MPGEIPVDVTVDATRHRAYVSNGRYDTMAVIDTQTNTVVDTIPISTLQYTLGPIGVDPLANIVAVVSDNYIVSIITQP